MNKSWAELRQFQSSELVKNRFGNRHGRSLSSTKANQIVSAISHGREYFESASSASMTVKPLLLYYGVISLSKGLVLFLDAQKNEEAIAPSHGLETKNWQQTLSTGWDNIQELSIKPTQRGMFRELISATQNQFFGRKGSSGLNWWATYPVCQQLENYEFRFENICQTIPEVRDETNAWLNKSYPCAQFESLRDADAHIRDWHFSQCINFEKLFSNTPPDNLELNNRNGKVSLRKEELPFLVQQYQGCCFEGIGEVWCVPNLPGDTKLNMPALFYLISYVLGMLVRYFPTQWSSLEYGKGNSVAPLIHRLTEMIESIYPTIVVDYLGHKIQSGKIVSS